MMQLHCKNDVIMTKARNDKSYWSIINLGYK